MAIAQCLLSLLVTQQILMYLNLNAYFKFLHAIQSSLKRQDEASDCSPESSDYSSVLQEWAWCGCCHRARRLLPPGHTFPCY